MNDLKALEHLGPIADEMLAGLHADQQLKMRIQEAARQKAAPRRRALRVLTPALCCAALALVCAGVVRHRLEVQVPGAAQIETLAAGDGLVSDELPRMIADLGDGATVQSAVPTYSSLFATGSGDIPMVSVGGAVYHMLTTPAALSSSLCGSSVGEVQLYTEEPSLATADEMESGLSNVAAEGTTVYELNGVASSTAVAAEVDGQLRVFQRVSYAGKGPGSQSLEDTFSVRGNVKQLELSGVGTLEGDAANDAIAVLLDHATLKSADASARKQSLTVTLESGIKLQLGVSGDTVCGCGGWSCPEFFEAFEAAL